MPQKYPLIVDASWREKLIHAESVPHFLHWDIAYLLVLEKDKEKRPNSWADRIAAWRRLLSLVLLGKLQIISDTISGPFSEHSKLYGVGAVGWLAERERSAPIGVVSPTVLVRPLPDFQQVDSTWPASPDDDPVARGKLRYFVGRAIQQLGGVPAGQDAVARKLIEVLKRDFAYLGELELADEHFPAEHQNFEILPRLTWIAAELQRATVTLLVSKVGKRWYVPKCAACGGYLTYDAMAEPKEVSEERVQLECPEPRCRAATSVELSDMLIWNRKRGEEVIVWKDRSSPGLDQMDFPPPARVSENIVTFEWDPGLGGQISRRFLALKFGGRIEEKAFHDILFGTLLVPGRFQPAARPGTEFTGLPIRPEWRDVLKESPKPQPRVGNGRAEVKYHLALEGWPSGFDYIHIHLREEPGLAVGIYPDLMNPRWKQYRLFALGKNREKFRLIGFQSDKEIGGATPRRITWALDADEGWPDWAAVIDRERGDAGVLFDLKALGSQAEPGPQAAAGTLPQVVIAVDFGTTNSLVYYQDQAFLEPFGPSTNAIETSPEAFLGVARILAGDTSGACQGQEGGFLPDYRAQNARPDLYLIPSAYWDGGEFPVIRWSERPPFAGAIPVHGFKWDKTGHPNQSRREAYLRELLFLAVPYALKKLSLHRETPQVQLGWAFPLAFSKSEYENLKTLWGALTRECRLRMGLSDVNHFSVDESKANVQAFGRHNPGESFLVADMGGGTIDLALFTFTTPEAVGYHQIGSVQFAGEKCLECLSKERYWEYRDSIQAGTSLLRNRAAQKLVDSFMRLAFEFLRTMYCGYQTGAPSSVRMVLVGNGWRLWEAVRDPRGETFDDYYAGLRGQVGEANLTLHGQLGDLTLRKHFVAQGALKNAKFQARDGVPERSRAKLPAGRDLTFAYGEKHTSVPWHQLVGDACDFTDVTAEELRHSISIDLASGPPKRERWDGLLPAAHPQPDMARLREWVADNIEGTTLPHLRKGPLQLLLENWWPRVLERMLD